MVMLSLTKEKQKREVQESSPVKSNFHENHHCVSLRKPKNTQVKTNRSETSMGSHQGVFLALNMHMNGEDHEFEIDEMKNAMPDIDPAYYKEAPNLTNVTDHNQATVTQEMLKIRQAELDKIHHKKDKTHFM